jgi:hypothetical protein
LETLATEEGRGSLLRQEGATVLNTSTTRTIRDSDVAVS